MEVLSKGTIQSLLIALGDKLNNVNDLSTDVTDMKFEVRRKSDDVVCETNKTVLFDSDYPMTAICEIDTTLGGYVAGDTYKIYLSYVSGSEHPKLDAARFRVEND